MNTSKVVNMGYMCQNCTSLTTIPEMDTSKVTYFAYTFYNCTSLTSIDWEIDMSSCTNCNNMFGNCTSLTGVKLKNVPSSLSLTNIGLSSDKYTVVNTI